MRKPIPLSRLRAEDNALEQIGPNNREAHDLLALIDAEFRTDPMSTQCFDARIVERVKQAVVKRKTLVSTLSPYMVDLPEPQQEPRRNDEWAATGQPARNVEGKDGWEKG